MELYQYSVGRDPDIRPGADRPGGSAFDERLDYVPRVLLNGIWREGENIGFNKLSGEAGCKSVLSVCYGLPISNTLNYVPGFNSFATLHDQWMMDLIKFKGSPMRIWEKLGSMAPALLINYGALYDKYNNEIE